MMRHSLLSYIDQSNATAVLHRYMYICNKDGGVYSMYPEHDNHIFVIKSDMVLKPRMFINSDMVEDSTNNCLFTGYVQELVS